MKNLIKNFMNGTYKYNGKWYDNVTNAGRVIKQNGNGCYYFYCDGVNDDQITKFCQEHNLDWSLYVVKSKRMNVFGTRERVVVEIWECE